MAAVKNMDHVLGILDGYRPTLVVVNACKIEIFDKVHTHTGPCTVNSLAAKHGWNPLTTRRLLNALVALQLLDKTSAQGQEDTYSVSPAGLCLTREHPENVWNFAVGLPSMLDQYNGLADTLKTGKGQHQEGHHDHDGDHHHGDEGHHHHHHGDDQHVEGKQADVEEDSYLKYLETCPPAELLDMYEWDFCVLKPYYEAFFRAEDMSWCKTAVDLGGGNGELAFALCNVHPSLQVTVYEAPPVAKMLRNHFFPSMKKLHPSLSLQIVEGNFFKDPIPKADLYIIANVLHGMEETKCVQLLQVIYKNLAKGGRILVVEKALNNTGVGPLSAHLLDLQHCGGHVRTESEYRELLSSIGFADTRLVRSGDRCSVDFIFGTK